VPSLALLLLLLLLSGHVGWGHCVHRQMALWLLLTVRQSWLYHRRWVSR
jgi:hypothetical protein